MRLVIALALAAACVSAQAINPEETFRKARKAERKGKVVDAYLLYAQAAAAAPDNTKYWAHAQALRTRAAVSAKVMPPLVRGAAPADDTAPEVAFTREEAEEARRPEPPVALTPSSARKSFDLRADSRTLFDRIAKEYGYDVVFDGDYQPSPPVRFRIENATYSEALYIAQAVTASFIVAVGPKLFMVVKDTTQKRTEQERAEAVSIPIPDPVTVQEAQELGRAVQQIMEIPKFAIDSTQRLVMMRGPLSKVEPARALFAQLLDHRPQVYLEVDVLSVGKATSLNLGLSPQAAFTLGTETVRSLTNFGNPFSYLRVAIAGTQLLANATTTESSRLLHTELRAADSQAAQIHIGDKYPIVMSTLAPIGLAGQGTYIPPPQFNFEDLGLTLKITPKVHSAEDLTLDVEAEFKTLGVGGFNGLPVISNRKFTNRVRLAFGQSTVIAGLLSVNEARTISGFAGLTDVPVLSPLLSLHTKTKDRNEALLVIRPHLISSVPGETAGPVIWTGTEARPRIPL